jgi:hypothetical protein
MKVGDLVRYQAVGPWGPASPVGIVLWINEAGGTVKVLTNGKIGWLVKSGCEVVSS